MHKMIWLLASLVIVTVLFGTIYVTVQQTYRQNANDPQIEIAEGITGAISAGQDPLQILPPQKIDLAKSLSVFVVIFDNSGKVLASTASLDGKEPTPPPSVLEAARNRQNRVTWQPRSGVRIASVTQHYRSGKDEGFVLVGRSLREVEARVHELGIAVLFGWAVSLITLLTAGLLASFLKRKQAI